MIINEILKYANSYDQLFFFLAVELNLFCYKPEPYEIKNLKDKYQLDNYADDDLNMVLIHQIINLQNSRFPHYIY